jgi:tRNA(adenine34) deaminase
MGRTIAAAREAEKRGERPFGCIIVGQEAGTTVIRGLGVGTGTDEDPTRHSEMQAIQMATQLLKRPLNGFTMYQTHEPCMMCCGAINHAKITRVVWGSYRMDLPELFRTQIFGAADLLKSTSQPCTCEGGVLREECMALFEGELSELASARAGL